MDNDPPEHSDNSQERNIWQRLRSFLRLNRQLDTTKELEQEIQDLLEEGEEQGLIGDLEERLINSIFDFRQTIASEIMTPSAEIVCAEDTATTAELIELITAEGYTRIPIYCANKDNIVGILHAKDLLRIYTVDHDKNTSLSDVLNPPYFINESKPITKLLLEFQANKSHMAVVTDEFGGVRGLVTLEDVIEEIVGDIDDEHDQEESELQIIDENTIVVSAKIDIEDVENHFLCTLPEGPYESVGGLIIRQLGRVPQIGATVTVTPLTFKVVAADRRRIKNVRIRKHQH